MAERRVRRGARHVLFDERVRGWLVELRRLGELRAASDGSSGVGRDPLWQLRHATDGKGGQQHLQMDRLDGVRRIDIRV